MHPSSYFMAPKLHQQDLIDRPITETWRGMCAGVLVLEELEHARARGAPILAEFLGGSFTCDAHHMTEPQPQGAGVKLCIERWALNLL